MKKIVLIALFLLPCIGFSQGEAAWWFFGQNASVDFNNGVPQSNVLGSLDTDEGCSSISDACGNLQFYSDGTTVWNRSGSIMLNGTGLLGNSSAAQSAIIVPDLIATNLYYIFTVDSGSQGVHYSVVDMNGDNGLGEILNRRKNRPVRPGNTHEKISAVIHADNRSYWVMTYADNSYQAFRVGGGAVNPTPVESLINSNLTDDRGTIKFNPEGSLLVNTSVGNGAVVADFDNATGIVTNQVNLGRNTSTSADSFYGAEFSPDSRILYTDMNSSSGGNFCSSTNTRAIFQYNITATNGNNNPNILWQSGGETIRGALQLGIDQKIYVARACEQFLGVIDNPSDLAGANYTQNGVRLRNGSESKEGLPPFITSFFTPQFTTSDPMASGSAGSGIRQDFCGGSTIQFDSSASDFCLSPSPIFDWDFGDGSTSNEENPLYTYAAPGTYSVTLTVTSFNLSKTTVETVIIFETPIVANPITSVSVCDDDGDGIATRNLNLFETPQILGTQSPAEFEVTYHSSSGEAENDAGALGQPIDFASGTTTIWARITNISTSTSDRCYEVTSFEVEVGAGTGAIQPDDYVICELDNNGFEEFDLTTVENQVTGGANPANFIFTYHETAAQASAGGTAIPNPTTYTNGQIDSDQVFIRMEQVGANACPPTTTVLNLIVSDKPVANVVNDIAFCDLGNDGSESIALTNFDAQVRGSQTNPDLNITYHLTQNDADSGTGDQSSTFDLTATTLFYVRIDDSTQETCYDTTTFEVSLDAVPVANTIADYRLCDDISNNGAESFDMLSRNAEILGAQDPTQFTIEYFTTAAEADLGSNGGATPVADNYSSGGQTIYARIENNDNPTCASTTSFELIVDDLPVATAPTTFRICDDQNDGVESVNLDQFDSVVLAGQSSTTFAVTYHDSQSDADAGIVDLPSSYDVNLGDTTIFIRIDNPNNETCNSTTESFVINLNEQAVANPMDIYRECDNDNDGTAVFDLTQSRDQLLDGQNPADFTVEFFISMADANLGSLNGATPVSLNYTSDSTVLYARIESNSNRDCADVDTVELFADPTPSAGTVASIVVCDDASNDGEQDINLADYRDDVLNGQTNPVYEVSFHANVSDANTGDDPLSSPYTVTRNTPTIFARVFNSNNESCAAVTSFDFVISPLPVASPVENIVRCDDPSNDGTVLFNLSEVNVEVLNGLNPADFDITFYASQADADVPTNQLADPYPSTALTPERIYVRMEAVLNPTCPDFTDFTIQIEPQPTAFIANDLEACDDEPLDGRERFDLSNQDADIYNGQDTGRYSISYHRSRNDADTRSNPLPTDYENVNDSEIIYARIENNSFTDCYDVSTFMINVFQRPNISNQGPITICAGVPETINAGSGYASYLWSTGETTQTIDVATGDDYTVTVTNAAGCDSSAIIKVRGSDVATITELEVQQFEVKTNKITVNVEGPGNYEYSLDDFVYQTSNVFDDLYPGFYQVFVRDVNGCGTVSKDVVIIGGPPYFTPNQDGFHDTWQIIAASTVPDALIYIFDRQGKLLKQLSAEGEGWDGTFNGSPMPSSDYWYLVELADGRSFKGHFALKR
jgi:gliding motility-associated-like protein